MLFASYFEEPGDNREIDCITTTVTSIMTMDDEMRSDGMGWDACMHALFGSRFQTTLMIVLILPAGIKGL